MYCRQLLCTQGDGGSQAVACISQTTAGAAQRLVSGGRLSNKPGTAAVGLHMCCTADFVDKQQTWNHTSSGRPEGMLSSPCSDEVKKIQAHKSCFILVSSLLRSLCTVAMTYLIRVYDRAMRQLDGIRHSHSMLAQIWGSGSRTAVRLRVQGRLAVAIVLTNRRIIGRPRFYKSVVLGTKSDWRGLRP